MGNVIFKSHVFELMLNTHKNVSFKIMNKNLKFNVANHFYILETTSFLLRVKTYSLNE